VDDRWVRLEAGAGDAERFASVARCCQSPSRPSKGWPGPVIPSAASSAANTPVRIAPAVAQPFHIESSPIRVTPSGTPDVIAMEMAFPMAAWSSPRILPAPQAAPIAANIPWSQPFRGILSARRQNASYAAAIAVMTARPSAPWLSATASTAGIMSLGWPVPRAA